MCAEVEVARRPRGAEFNLGTFALLGKFAVSLGINGGGGPRGVLVGSAA